MVEQSFASRRGGPRVAFAFPTTPMLDAGLPSTGFALIGSCVEDLFKLKSVRNMLIGAWQGQIVTDLGEQPVLVILFSDPISLVSLHLGNVLRLSPINGRLLASFAMQPGNRTNAVHTIETSALSQIDIWWNGKRQHIKLYTENRLSLSELWEMPEIHVHPLLRDSAEETDRTAGSVSEQGIGEQTARLMTARQAQIPIKGDAEIGFDDALNRDRDLDERTRLKSIAAQLWGKLSGRKTGQGGEQGQEEGPGILSNMAGWLLWHTPLGLPLAKQLAERMKLVERLMASGDADSALRLALKLGSANTEARKKIYPTKLQGMRTSLDFNISSSRFAAPIIIRGNFTNLYAQYDAFAKMLEKKGDFKRAAYIRAQLQENYEEGVRTLARGKLFLDAAKLAVDAKLAPILAIEMFYKAGEHTTALALAKREDCFDQLAEASRKKDPEFHAYVLRAWTDRLIATNQPLRALQVTDFLADDALVDQNLLERRLSWIDMIFNETGADTPSPEAIARVLLSAEWHNEKNALATFAIGNTHNGYSREIITLDTVQNWVNDKESGRLSELFDHLFRMANLQSTEQASFWKLAAPIVIERIALALISQSEGLLSQNQKDGLRSLLQKAKLEVLVTDIRKLKLQNSDEAPKQKKWYLPPSTAQASPASQGCLVGNDTMVVWRQSGLLQLLDPKGRILWQGNMSQVEALIPIGSSSDILIVQQVENAKLLSRFSTSKHIFSTIGQIDLTAYHDITSDGQWLVQIGEQIGALDLAKLCALQPDVEFLWSSRSAPSVEVISFLHRNSNPQWLTRDISDTQRNGLLESWSLQNGRTLKTWLISITSNRDAKKTPARFWSWNNYHNIQPSTKSGWGAHSIDWTLELETEYCDIIQHERAQGQYYVDQFMSCDHSRAILHFDKNDKNIVECISAGRDKRTMILHSDDEITLTCLARGTSPSSVKEYTADRSNMLLFAASDGRLLFVDTKHQKVTLF